MTFEVSPNPLDQISADALVVYAFFNKKEYMPTRGLTALDTSLLGLLSQALDIEGFKGKPGEVFSFYTQKKIASQRIFVLGLGEEKEFNPNALRRNVALLAKRIKSQGGKTKSLAFDLLEGLEIRIEPSLQAQMVAEGILLGSYTFHKYKKEEESLFELETVIFSETNRNVALKVKEGTDLAVTYYQATKLARDLVNEPAAVVTPTFLAKVAQDIAKGNPQIRVTIFDKPELEKMGMGAFLGIAQAADTPCKFISLEYTPKKRIAAKTKLALVGKGITFDSGGINVKTGDHMQTMKMDMSGAAAVLGTFSVIAKIAPPYPVMGLIAATANMVSGKSIVPGDVLKALNGKTIEVLNTDAEGRVTMADSLSYAVKKGATEIVDLATLTGACMVALGTDIAGLLGNDKTLKERIKKAADEAGEKVWELPLEQTYKELNKSEVADVANIPSTRYGGTITGALFLEEFVDGRPWVHLDIAGPAFVEKSYDFGPKGGTGFGVRTLLNLLRAY